MGVALPDDLRAKLDAAVAESGNSLAEEIRRRLERSFAKDAAKRAEDPKTRELADDVMWLADEIGRQAAPAEGAPWLAWHSNVNSHAALSEALRTWMEIIKPQLSGGASDLFGPGDPPTLGRATARHLQRFKAAMARSEQELRELYERKEKKP